MARKLKMNLVALGSAAIMAVYAIGYVVTEPAAQAGNATTASTSTNSAAPDSATAIAQTLASAQAPPNTASSANSASPVSYRDGTFTGTGSSRRGNITAAVTIQGGKVTGVKITQTDTYYPLSDIARLPGEVVSRQSANVDFVSGATESSRAFRGAVGAALSQARASSSVAPSQAVTSLQG